MLIISHHAHKMPDRILSRFLGTDVRYIAMGSFWLLINKIASLGVAFLLSIAYARYLEKDIYGSYRYVLSFIGFFGICAIPGMGTALIRSIARGAAGAFHAASRTIFLFSFGISIACAFSAFYFYNTGNSTLAIGFLAAAFLTPFSEGLGSWRSYFAAVRLFHKGTTLSSVVQTLYGICMISVVAIVVFYHLSAQIAVFLLVATYLAAHAIPNILLTRHVSRIISPHAPTDTSTIPYGFHLSASEIPSTIATYLDSILLYNFLGPAALATYSFAIAPVDQLKSVFGTAATVSMPKLAEKTARADTHAALQKTLPVKLFRASIFTTGVIVVYIMAAPFLFHALFPQYHEAIVYTQVFALSLTIFPVSVFGTALKAEGNMKKIYLLGTVGPLIQIGMLAVLIPLYGIWGAVAARVGGRFLNDALLTYLYYRR